MNQQSPYQILDDILSCFNLDQEDVSIPHNDLYLEMVGKNPAYATYFTQAITKLIEEKYIKPEDVTILSDGEREEIETVFYDLTFEGVLLIKSGGYVEKIDKETAILRRAVLHDKIVTYGAGLAGLYVLYETIPSIFAQTMRGIYCFYLQVIDLFF